jgi:putative transposase
MVTDDPRTCQFSLSENQRRILEAIVRRTHCPLAIATRAKIVLAADEGLGMTAIGQRLGCSRDLARRWRDRFAEGLARWGASADQWDFDTLTDKVTELLQDNERSGAPAKFTPEQLCQIVALACEVPEEASKRPVSHWTARELADEATQRKIVPSISPRHAGRFLKKWTFART